MSLLPKLRHRLVLSRTRGWGVLRRLDKLVRRRVGTWLKLPHDTTNVFIHADVKDRATIPFMKSKRLKRLAMSVDPMIIAEDIGSGISSCKMKMSCNQPPQIIVSVYHPLT